MKFKNVIVIFAVISLLVDAVSTYITVEMLGGVETNLRMSLLMYNIGTGSALIIAMTIELIAYALFILSQKNLGYAIIAMMGYIHYSAFIIGLHSIGLVPLITLGIPFILLIIYILNMKS